MLEIAVKSFLILGSAWLVVRLLRRYSAAARHLVWTIALAGLLLLPLLTVVLPSLPLPIRSAPVMDDLVFRVDAAGHRSSQDPLASAGTNAPVKTPLLPWLLWIWSIGSALSLTQMLIGWISLERLKKRTSASRRLGRVELLEIPEGNMPMTSGLFRPVIFLPPNSSRTVLLHELAHVRRGDAGAQVIARTALALYWWNPLAWFAWREFLKERELAADDLVLQKGASSVKYAGDLLTVARHMQSTSWPAVAMASRSQLEGRLEAILDRNRNRKAPRIRFVIVAAACGLIVVGSVASLNASAGDTASNLPPAIVAGDAAREAGKTAEAKADYTKAITGAANNHEASLALIRRGTVELEMRDEPAALADFNQAQATDSSVADKAEMWMAIALQHDGKPDEAAEMYQRSLASGKTADALELYSQLLDQQGKKTEAADMRKQASDLRIGLQAPVLASPNNVYRAGKDVHSPVLVQKVEPGYTAEARIARYSGTAILSTVVGADGLTHDVQVMRGLGFGLDQKAVEAVTQWRFKPGIRDGRAVNVRASIEVQFRLF